jgi:hypothetical protein
MPTILATQEAEVGGSQYKAAQTKAQDPIWKTNKSKRTGAMAEVVEHFWGPEFSPQDCQ